MLQTLDAPTVRRWLERAADLVGRERSALDAMNVFPVADGDTGTNLTVTLRAAADAAGRLPAPADLAGALRAVATAALRAARGNSGVILAQLLRGLADAAAADARGLRSGPAGGWDAPALRRALTQAADAAWAAVAVPVEGTMLSVARAVATAAARDTSPDLAGVLQTAAAAARSALQRTPSQLPVLAEHGVVDAGARGLVLVLESLLQVVTGDAPTWNPPAPGEPMHRHPSSAGGPAYEVMYLLQLAPDREPGRLVDSMRAQLAPLGDSLVVADDGAGLWSVHVHVDDVGAAIEVGAAAAAGGGRMEQVRVTRFGPADAPDAPAARAVVVAEADLLGAARSVFAGEDVVVLGPDEPLPEHDVVVVAIGETPFTAQRHGVTVVPVRSVVQAVAAVAVHDASRRALDDTVAMAEAAGACRYAHLSVADAEALTMAGRCRPGDVLGYINGEIAVIGADALVVGCDVIDRLLASGGELVTVLFADGAEALAGHLARHARRQSDHLDVTVTAVGPMAAPILLGVE